MVLGLRPKRHFLAHHPRYSTPIPSVLVPHVLTALHPTATPTLTPGSALFATRRVLTNCCTSSRALQFRVPSPPSALTLATLHHHTRYHHRYHNHYPVSHSLRLHHGVSACAHSELFLSGPSHLRKQRPFSPPSLRRKVSGQTLVELPL